MLDSQNPLKFFYFFLEMKNEQFQEGMMLPKNEKSDIL
jgi:hypothetical protein